MPQDKKPFKDTRIGRFLKDKAPHILDRVADFLPDRGAVGFIKHLIDRDETLSNEDRTEAMELIRLEFEQEKEISRRWESDMRSDSWLSKNARPIVLLYSWLLLTLVVAISFWEIELPAGYVSLLEVLFTGVNMAYFGGRVIEKYHARKLS